MLWDYHERSHFYSFVSYLLFSFGGKGACIINSSILLILKSFSGRKIYALKRQ